MDLVSPGWTKLVQFGTSGSVYIMADVLMGSDKKFYPTIRVGFLSGQGLRTDMNSTIIKQKVCDTLDEAREVMKNMKDIRLIDA